MHELRQITSSLHANSLIVKSGRVSNPFVIGYRILATIKSGFMLALSKCKEVS